MTFQFHKGSIRTVVTAKTWSRKSTFQFHKGSIRTKKSDEIGLDKIVSIP